MPQPGIASHGRVQGYLPLGFIHDLLQVAVFIAFAIYSPLNVGGVTKPMRDGEAAQ